MAEPKLSSAHLPDWARAWQRTLFDAGWLVPGWPPELGGRNASPVEQMIYFEEFSKREHPAQPQPAGSGDHRAVDPRLRDSRAAGAVPAPDAAGRGRVVPRDERTRRRGATSRACGRERSRPPTIDGRDHFVVNGQKVWTSGAHHADWCLCFVRTDPELPKHKGISALIIDMQTPGVEARPFAELSEPDFFDFNEVFFTDALVPAREPARRAQRGLADHAGFARARAGDVVDHLRVRRATGRCRTRRRSATDPDPTAAAPARRRPLPRRGRRLRDRRAGTDVAWATAASRSS